MVAEMVFLMVVVKVLVGPRGILVFFCVFDVVACIGHLVLI